MATYSFTEAPAKTLAESMAALSASSLAGAYLNDSAPNMALSTPATTASASPIRAFSDTCLAASKVETSWLINLTLSMAIQLAVQFIPVKPSFRVLSATVTLIMNSSGTPFKLETGVESLLA
ncbi:MAG: hypothetical protein BWY95_01512 [Bacteroidetes bacterium ADurb.BinA104]|nr:MAG: hypothetical protein BWY95_01512 [Bacteroidetes bacterium ADurb.BinA104]